jgi:predicted helicase
LKGGEHIGILSSADWHGLGKEFFAEARALAAHQPVELSARSPRPHQERAIEKAAAFFADPAQTRGKLIMPCGTGKSLTAFWIAQKLEAETILIAVPSLALMRQTLHVWLEELAARGREVRWLCVCSDETVGQRELRIVFTTYQSGKVLAAASSAANATFDLGLFDEAHKTVGQRGKAFGHLLFDEHVSITRRVFMTATERRYAGESDDILSMDD